jgi:hypothetical protein
MTAVVIIVAVDAMVVPMLLVMEGVTDTVAVEMVRVRKMVAAIVFGLTWCLWK